MMTSRTGAGLLGFLLALASYSSTRVEAAPGASAPADALDARLTRLTEAFRANESTLHIVPTNDPVYVAAYGFLNNAPSFRNHTGGWLNRVGGWHNAGVFHNSGGSFLNNLPSFRNAIVGWPNRISGWLNGGAFRNGGSFRNGGGGFRNGGGFYNR
jgi:rSAM-associated Gly-rich repeat protein